MQFPEELLKDPDYRHFTAVYDIDKLELAKASTEYITTPITNKYAVLSCKQDIGYTELRNKTRGVIDFIEKVLIYTPQSINPIDSSGITTIKSLETLNLTGNGVLVGTVDTGINYLNKTFLDKNDNTRIECIWDQTVYGGKKVIEETVEAIIGSIYVADDINKAIKVSKEGGDPYEIVPSKDEDGHGTKMAAIIAAKENSGEVIGVAPNCNLVVVKLVESYFYKRVLKAELPVYDVSAIFTAIKFLVDYAVKVNKPIVIYVPLGCNFTNHRGDTLLENYIDDISINRGVVVVTACGNEGNSQCHTSGVLKFPGDTKDVGIYVDPIQEYLATQIWVRKANIMVVNVISPSGEETGVVQAFINSYEERTFIFEETRVTIMCDVAEESSGDQLIEIHFWGVKSGTWKLRLIATQVLDGHFDAWLPQVGLIFGKTQFINADPYGTLMSPGSSLYTINVACYDQTKNYIVNSSARSFEDDLTDRVDIAAGGINVVTTNLNGDGSSIVSGTSVSAAVVAGACVLILQWGIVDGNSNDMYSQKIKTFLIRGTFRRSGDIYPNPELGYGVLDIVGVFRYMT